MTNNLFEFHDIEAQGHAGGRSIRGIRLSLPQGSTGLVLGGPHSGKTLLMQLAAGEVMPNTGQIWFRGAEVSSMPVWLRRRRGIALASQSPPRFDHFTAEAQICLGLNCRHLPDKLRHLIARHLPEAIPLLDTPMHQLSRQAHRLIDIASCLATLPALILIDEPSVDFGPERAVAIAHSLREADITLLIAERYAAPMLEIADYGWLLSQGRIALHGPAAELTGDDRVSAACIGDEIEA